MSRFIHRSANTAWRPITDRGVLIPVGADWKPKAYVISPKFTKSSRLAASPDEVMLVAKADAPKKKKAKLKAKLTDKEQSERFKETARKLGADETGKQFERAIGKIISSGPPSTKRPA